MTPSRILVAAAVVAAVALSVARSRDPHRTKLPFGTTDLFSVRAQLRALPDSERVLVEGYVQRSRGDVLPEKFADPDDPLTARTFAEAIALQRRFLAARAVTVAQAEARARERDAKLAPLRAALEAEVAERVIVARELAALPPGPFLDEYRAGTKRAIDDTPVLVTTYRLRNVSGRSIDSVKVLVEVAGAADGAGPRAEILSYCFLERRQPLAPGQSDDYRCTDVNRTASGRDSAFAALPVAELVVRLTPRSIAFGDGTSLTYSGD